MWKEEEFVCSSDKVEDRNMGGGRMLPPPLLSSASLQSGRESILPMEGDAFHPRMRGSLLPIYREAMLVAVAARLVGADVASQSSGP